MSRETRDFFTLRKPYEELSTPSEFWALVDGDDEKVLKDLLFRPDKLESVEPPKRWRVRNKKFCNVSFSKTLLSQIEFTDCHFEECLFTGSVIYDCRFNFCIFVNCNFYRARIQECFIDPKAFAECLDPKRHANIGVGLYQELLHNSRQQAQTEFTSYAQYKFVQWKRYLKRSEIRNSDAGRLVKLLKSIALVPSWLFELTTGSGMRLSNLAITSCVLLATITGINYFYCSTFGLSLQGDPVLTITEAFYFSTIVVTSLGFGDITPGTDLGRIVVAFEAIVGFLTFALLVSMTFRKITS
ncbi:pentapeptide repeat protein [Palleronia aestuarii]|uniref:Pentapeptide repeat protein n=1 Tax=Palleronia aestuarii TaxID=568105 RepID=A0A2W7NK12_9RHOB|nr:ion channel [Palleronia aestuarii]PZX18417.1 pentapeptide repeat protein [Palleronia aestuarii]